LGGGGRYDDIITRFMDDSIIYPAVGMSFGLEPISAVLSAKGRIEGQIIDLYLIPMDTQTDCLRLANELRKRGASVLVEYSKQKVKKSMAYADREKIPFVSVIGSTETEKNVMTIKRMTASENASDKEQSFQMTDYEGIAGALVSNK